MRFAGYAALFGVRDGGGDIIRKGAFARTLTARQSPLPLFWQHRPDMRIGWVESVAEDAKGLRVIANIDNPEGGAAAALKAGSANGLSFGYRARQYTRDSKGRELTDIDLQEVSLVSHPMQHTARVHLVEGTVEQKFNQRHYRENGQFARVGEGVLHGSGGGSSRSDGVRLGGSRQTLVGYSPAQTNNNSPAPDLRRAQNGNLRQRQDQTERGPPRVNKVDEGLTVFRSRGQTAFEDWTKHPGGEGTFRTHAPQTVSLFRERSARFREAERRILDQSIKGWIQKPVEHTLLVYRNLSPGRLNEFQFRILKGDPKSGIMGPFREPATGKVLKFGQLPQLAGHELFIAEHVHPTPRRGGIGPRSFHGPSNADLYHADSNPRTLFIIRHVDTNGIFDGLQTSFSYYGRER